MVGCWPREFTVWEKLPVPFERGGDFRLRHRAGDVLFEVFEVIKEEDPVPLHRPAGIGAEVVIAVDRLGESGIVIGPGVGVEVFIAQVLERDPVKRVGARLVTTLMTAPLRFPYSAVKLLVRIETSWMDSRLGETVTLPSLPWSMMLPPSRLICVLW